MRNKNTNHLNNWDKLQQLKGNFGEGDKNLKYIWEHSDGYGQDYEPNVEQGLSSLKNKLKNEQQPTARRIIMRQWIKMAAAILIIGLSGIAVYHYLGSNINIPIAQIEVQTRQGEKLDFILPDGSTVTLNENSQLSYDPDLNTANNRMVQLQGEAFFDVDKRPNQPFIITTTQSEIEVLGTSFNVRAYHDETQTEVEVSTGRVAFHDLTNHQQSILTAKEVGILNHSSNHIQQLTTVALNRTAWKTGKLIFKKTELQTALTLIARYYSVEINGETKDLSSCTLSGNWHNESLEDVLTYTEDLTGIEFQKTADRVYHLKRGCK